MTMYVTICNDCHVQSIKLVILHFVVRVYSVINLQLLISYLVHHGACKTIFFNFRALSYYKGIVPPLITEAPKRATKVDLIP